MCRIKVSIGCITYNQEDYIADAIESFLNQETNFEYEIWIHDDASTDGTANIIREYMNRYPQKVFAVFQNENQYSKGEKVERTFLWPRYNGKYVALCEGDDYWIDSHKLQKQYDYMENHPDCSICMHSAVNVESETKIEVGKSVFSKCEKDYYIEDAIRGIGRTVATNSFFYRKSAYQNHPIFCQVAPCDDYVIPIVCVERGYIHYIPDIMSAHRIEANNSLSSSWRIDPAKKMAYNSKYEKMLDELDKYTEGQYHSLIEEERTRLWFKYYFNTKEYGKLKEECYKQYIRKLPIKKRINIFMEINCPKVLGAIRKIKKSTKK